MESIRKKIKNLREQIRRHDHLYYNLDKPEISDREYDRLYKELESLEKKHPHLITPDSPTQRVPGEPLEKFKKEAHNQKMLSLQNTYSKEEIEEFYDRILKLLEEKNVIFFAEPKFDGVAVELIYEKGFLTKALTRGDGEVGENITENIKTIPSIPLRLLGGKNTNFPPLLEVRGEVVIFKKDFLEMNRQREKEGQTLFANPRNAAAGTLRQLNPKITAERPLRFYAHGPGLLKGLDVNTQSLFLKSIKNFAIPSLEMKEKKEVLRFPKLLCLCKSLKDILGYYKKIEKARHTFPFDTDGIVIKVDSFEKQNQLGEIARSPRWAVAGKFEPTLAQTQIEDIVLQVGRTGVVTPVAVMTPVQIDGVRVRQASLHNFKELSRKDVRKGDWVEVRRAGDVIPEVVKALTEKRDKTLSPFKPPDKCPGCEGPLKPDGDYLRCFNSLCPAMREKALIHFASKKCMNIEFLGEKSIEKFYKLGWLNSFSSFYKLPEKPLAKEEGFGEKSSALLKQSLKKSKQTTLTRLLSALGIHGVGEETARKLSEAVKNRDSSSDWNILVVLDILVSMTEEELMEIPDVGEIVAQSIKSAFQNKDLVQDLKNLHDMGVHFLKETDPEVTDSPLKGKKFVITGQLPLPREKVKLLIEEQGGKVLSAISGKTDGLICGENPGSKKEKAESLAVKILTWEEFQKLLEG